MRAYIKVSLLTLCVAWGAQAVDRIWIKSENGSWNNAAYWYDGVPALNDNAIFTNVFTGYVNFWPSQPAITKIVVSNPDNIRTRVFKNSTQIMKYGEFVKGKSALEGTISVTASSQTTSVGMLAEETAWLTLQSAGVFSAYRHALYIGGVENARGQVTVKGTARLSLSMVDPGSYGLSVGRAPGSIGSFVQEAGTVQGVSYTFIGYDGYGAYEMQGGVFGSSV